MNSFNYAACVCSFAAVLIMLSTGGGQEAHAQETSAQDTTAQNLSPQEAAAPRVIMAVHGGAGTILRENLSAEEEERYRAKLREALLAGYGVLTQGGTSLDAVTAAITLLESSPLFNAGRGAVFTNEGTVEHDASIMEGKTRNAGAVAGVKRIEHPIELARLVMEASDHVMLAGDGAEAFAQEQGVPMVENAFFHTERRRAQLERSRAQEDGGPRSAPRNEVPRDGEGGGGPLVKKYGTVGAVALDQSGTLAAGTSTGGMTNKRWGRIGDSPIIGAGTYADNATCAVSSTGHGEYFIRGVVPHDIASMMRYGGASLEEAAATVVMEHLPAIGEGGTGGVIALDAEGNVAMPFNTPGMYRGYVDEEGTVTVRIYKDE